MSFRRNLSKDFHVIILKTPLRFLRNDKVGFRLCELLQFKKLNVASFNNHFY
ncbi:hypothetical protein ACFP3I_18940 [Chryseobacterium arachidis]|uniref:hypothetical protein n=1 Tax=Chryseobacterium arachidis TaxID=1416778 RepID=UPI00362236A8